MSTYAENKAWGDQKEKECAKLLQDLYTEVFIRRADVTDDIKPQEMMREIPSQPNFNIFPRGVKEPIYGWCESSRKTYEEFLFYKDKLYVKLKTFKTMEKTHYLIKPLVRESDDTITDVVAIAYIDMEKINVIHQANIPSSKPKVGSGMNAIVKVNQHSILVRNRKKTAETFLEALLNKTS